MATNLWSASKPPASLLDKFIYYRHKYGWLHSLGSYVGRHHLRLWRLAGPLLTKRYLRRWMALSEIRRVNLGGGSHCLDGCLTVDVDPRADAFVDITKILPFADSSVHAIFCEEVIEHLTLSQGKRLLTECWRILVPGGVLRLTTPDLDWFVSGLSADDEAWVRMNSIFYDHEHRCIYTREALRRCCRQAAFGNLLVSTYRDCTSKLGYLDSHADRYQHPPEMSQYLEAEKPVTEVRPSA